MFSDDYSGYDYEKLSKSLSSARKTYTAYCTWSSLCQKALKSLDGLSGEEKRSRLTEILKSSGIDITYDELQNRVSQLHKFLIEGTQVVFAMKANEIIASTSGDETMSNLIEETLINATKQLIDALYNLSNSLNQECAVRNISVDIPDKDRIEADFICYYLYVAAQDGIIGKCEIDTINSVFNTTLDVGYWQNLLESRDEFFNYQDSLAESAVLLFSLAQQLDKDSGGIAETSCSCADILVRLYSNLGLLASLSDGNIDESEVEFVLRYVNNLNTFFCNNASLSTPVFADDDLCDIESARIQPLNQDDLESLRLVDEVAESIASSKTNTEQLIAPSSASGVKGIIESIKLIKRAHEHKKVLNEKEKQLNTAKQQLTAHQDEYQDNLYILGNYDEIIKTQNNIIATSKQDLNALYPRHEDAKVALAAATAALTTLYAEQELELEPYSERKDELEQQMRNTEDRISGLKNEIDDLNRQSYSAEGIEKRHAQEKIDLLNDQLSIREEDLSEIKSKLDSLDYEIDKVRNRHLGIAAPLVAAESAAAFEEQSLRSYIEEAEDRLDTAERRIKRCNYVVSHPELTPALAETIRDEEESIDSQDVEVQGMREEQAQLKAASKKGKIAIGVIVGVVIALIIAVILIVSFASGNDTAKTSSSANQQQSSLSSHQSKNSRSGNSNSNSATSSNSNSSASMTIKPGHYFMTSGGKVYALSISKDTWNAFAWDKSVYDKGDMSLANAAILDAGSINHETRQLRGKHDALYSIALSGNEIKLGVISGNPVTEDIQGMYEPNSKLDSEIVWDFR